MNKSTRYEFIVIILFFLIIFLVAWMKLFPTPLADADYVENSKPVKLRIVSYSLNDELEGLEVEHFLKENPKIKLKIDTYPVDLYYDLLTSELSYNDCHEIIAVEHPAVIDKLISSDDLVPLNNHMDSSYWINNDLANENAHYLSPPTDINSYVIYCNKDILTSLNINLTNPTLEEFVMACERIKTHEITPIALGTRSWASVKNIVIQLTSDVVDNPWYNAMSNIQLLEPYFQKNSYLNDYQDSQISFIQGNSCFYFGRLNEKEKIISESSFPVLVTNLKVDDKCTVWYDYTGMYALSMKAENKLVALDFLKYITNKSEHVIDQEYLSSLNDLNNDNISDYKCNWMYDDNGKNIKMYIEKLKDYSP